MVFIILVSRCDCGNQRFKGANLKCKLAEVTDVLDAECVTFRTAARAARRATQRASPKKKKKKGSPAKKKSSGS